MKSWFLPGNQKIKWYLLKIKYNNPGFAPRTNKDANQDAPKKAINS